MLGKPYLLIIPKVLNVVAGCVVLSLLLLRWLPGAVREYKLSEENADNLRFLATTDGLTGLYNRRHFEAVARTEWRRSQRYIRPLSLLVLDVDYFKSVNDRFGHDVGDSVLKTIAGVCLSSKRDPTAQGGSAAKSLRYCCPKPTRPQPRIVAERLCEMVRYAAQYREEKVKLSVSIGVASATLSMSGIEALMKRADLAMYEAKRGGRDRVVTAVTTPETVKLAAE